MSTQLDLYLELKLLNGPQNAIYLPDPSVIIHNQIMNKKKGRLNLDQN